MKRTTTLPRLGLGANGVELPNGLTRVKHEPVRVYDGFLSGLMHFGFHDLKDQLKSGDLLKLRRDYDNPYDNYAVSAYWKGVQLGYLKMYDNIVIANLLDSGIGMSAFISELDLSKNPNQALSIVLFADLVVAMPSLTQKFQARQTAPTTLFQTA